MYNLNELRELKDKFPRSLTSKNQRMAAVNDFLKYLANEDPKDHSEDDLIYELKIVIHYLKNCTLEYIPR